MESKWLKKELSFILDTVSKQAFLLCKEFFFV